MCTHIQTTRGISYIHITHDQGSPFSVLSAIVLFKFSFTVWIENYRLLYYIISYTSAFKNFKYISF